MKKLIILLTLLATVQTTYAAQPIEQYRLPNGQVVTTYLFEDGRVGYTPEDAGKVKEFYLLNKSGNTQEITDQNLQATVNTIQTWIDATRTLRGYLGK